MQSLGLQQDMPRVVDWVSTMDAALQRLDQLKAGEKQRLVTALIEVVTHDGQVAASELELLRVTCDLVHVPMPLLTASRQTSPRS
jgi:uncharacterized tellurite resistance protein B-like protein